MLPSACETLNDESERVKQFRQETCDKLEVKLNDKGEKLSDLLLLYPPLCTVRSAIIEHLSLGLFLFEVCLEFFL